MSFVLNDANIQQMSFLDSYNTLTDREKSFLKSPGLNTLPSIFFLKLMRSPMPFFTVIKTPVPTHR